LGGGEVKLLEHASAYSAFAREGKIRPIASILRIEDKDGKIIEEFKEEKEKKVLDPETARLINDILSDNDARAYVFGENNWLTFASRPVAAKTGTTNDYHDAWTIGYTPSIVTGVWVGNNDNSEMKRGAAGGVVAAPIWHDYMKKVLGDTPIEYFNKPEEIITGKPVLDGETEIGVKIKIDKFSGLLATEFTPPELIEEKIYKQDHSILYYVKKDDPRGDPPPSPENDPQFSLWENAVLEWAKKRGLTPDSPPTGFDNVHKLENRPQFKIIAPAENQTIMEALLTTRIEATAPRGIAKAEYYLDDSLFSVSSNYPFNLEKLIDFLNNGFHNLKVRVCDDVYNCSEKSLEFNLILDETPKKEEVGVQWITPSDGLAVTPLDFPLTIKIAAINPDQIGKIIVYAVSPKNTKFIAVVIGPINNEAPAGDWLKFPAPGTYKLFAEAYGWNGQFAKSKEITINLSDK